MKSTLQFITAIVIAAWDYPLRSQAGDAVAIEIQNSGVRIFYDNSSTPKGGGDYGSSVAKRGSVLNHARSKGCPNATVIHTSELTGYFCIAGGQMRYANAIAYVGYGVTAAAAKSDAFRGLNGIGATIRQKVIAAYFSYGERPAFAPKAQ